MMKVFICILSIIVAAHSLPKPEPYKESASPLSGLDTYGSEQLKRKFSSFDFTSPSKLEFGQASAVDGTSDIGPKDVAAELHAKIEEAAQHALAIIDGAKTFAEEAEKEQV